MGALLAFLLVDYSRVCAANASNEVECILLKKIPHPWWSPREAMTGTVCFLNSSLSLCDVMLDSNISYTPCCIVYKLDKNTTIESTCVIKQHPLS